MFPLPCCSTPLVKPPFPNVSLALIVWEPQEINFEMGKNRSLIQSVFFSNLEYTPKLPSLMRQCSSTTIDFWSSLSDISLDKAIFSPFNFTPNLGVYSVGSSVAGGPPARFSVSTGRAIKHLRNSQSPEIGWFCIKRDFPLFLPVVSLNQIKEMPKVY